MCGLIPVEFIVLYALSESYPFGGRKDQDVAVRLGGLTYRDIGEAVGVWRKSEFHASSSVFAFWVRLAPFDVC